MGWYAQEISEIWDDLNMKGDEESTKSLVWILDKNLSGRKWVINLGKVASGNKQVGRE